MSTEFSIITFSPGETQRLGYVMGEAAFDGLIVLLSGPLGGGKTHFVQGLARGLGVTGAVTSPTFVLVRELRGGRLTLFHADLYRLHRLEEISDLGLSDYLGTGVVAVEWAEKAPGLFPDEHVFVKIDATDDNQRRFDIVAHGARCEQLLNKVKTRMAIPS